MDESGIPMFVRIALTESAADLDRVVGLLQGAENIDWVSDVADLFRIRLDRLTRLVVAVGTRIDLADIAVRALARSA
jgi:hypothetical protein